MKRFYVLTMCLSMGAMGMMAASSSPARVWCQDSEGICRSYSPNALSGTPFVKETTRKVTPLSEGGSSSGGGSSSWDEDNFIVRCSYDWNPEEWMLQYITAVNVTGVYDGEYHPYDYSQGPTPVPINYGEVELPKGTYDFICQFIHMNPKCRYGWDYEAYIFKENVEVTGDMELFFNPAEANIEINVVTYNPDGSVSTLPKGNLVTEDDYEVTESGNISMALVQSQVYHEIYGKVIGRITEVSGQVTGGDYGLYDGFKAIDFHINQVSDKYTFRQLRLMPSSVSGEGVFVAVAWQRGSRASTISNKTDSYLDCTQKFETTPAGIANPALQNIEYATYFPSLFHGEQSSMVIGLAGRTEKYMKVFCSDADADYGDEGGLYALQSRFTDAAVESESGSSSSGGIQVYTNLGANLNPFSDGDSEYLFFPTGDFRYWPGGSLFPLNPYPGNKAFSVPYDKTRVYNGSTSPLLVSYISEVFSPYSGYAIPYFKYDYVGSLNEERKSDIIGLGVQMYKDGELIGEGDDALFEWSFFYDPSDNGPMKVIFDNSNFEMDGIKGGNKAEVEFDLSKEDHYPPTLTMLQFVDGEGNLTNSVDDPEGLKVRLGATDYTNQFGEPNSWGSMPNWLEVSVPDFVKAEIAPYGEDSFMEINLSVYPDKFYTHGFGAYYEGSLADLDMPSSNGLFDIRVTVGDDAGNRQIQTVSAALKIGTLSGIAPMEFNAGMKVEITDGNVLVHSSEAVNIIVYNMSGTKVAASDSSSLTLESLEEGAYLINVASGKEHTVMKFMK